jgi:hypothetical protein
LEPPVQHSPSSSQQALQHTSTAIQTGCAVVPAGKEGNDICSYTCGKPPCEWLGYGVAVLDAINEQFDVMPATTSVFVVEKGSGNEVSNNKIRFSLYQMFTYEKFGFLGKENRMKIPNCMETKAKELFPALNGNYTNFRAESATNLLLLDYYQLSLFCSSNFQCFLSCNSLAFSFQRFALLLAYWFELKLSCSKILSHMADSSVMLILGNICAVCLRWVSCQS